LVPEGDFEIAAPVDPTSLDVSETQEDSQAEDFGEIQPASPEPASPEPSVQVETQSPAASVPSPVSSPRSELKSKLAALLAVDQDEEDSDDDQESQCSYGDEAGDDDLEVEGFDYD
jgi:hypothetical protein